MQPYIQSHFVSFVSGCMPDAQLDFHFYVLQVSRLRCEPFVLHYFLHILYVKFNDGTGRLIAHILLRGCGYFPCGY
jgi:hypothetical protein